MDESFLIPLLSPTNCEKFRLCKQGRFLLGRVVNYFREFYINKTVTTGTFQVDRTIFATSVVTGVGIHTALHYKNYGTGNELESCDTNDKLRLKRRLLTRKILDEDDSDELDDAEEDKNPTDIIESEDESASSSDSIEDEDLAGTSNSNVRFYLKY